MDSTDSFEHAPQPAPTRRGWLRLGVAGAASAAVGWFAGFYSTAPSAAAPRAVPSDDLSARRLQWARELGASASIEELVDQAPAYLQMVQVFGDDPDVWTGVERLAVHVLERDDLPDRARLAQLLEAAVDHGGSASLRRLLPRLARVPR